MNKRHLDHLLAIYDDLAPDERQRVDDAMAERPHLAAKLATYRAQDRALDDFARFQARRLDPKWSDEMNTQTMLAAQPATQRGMTARLHTPRVDGWLHRLLHPPVTAFQFSAMSAVVVMIVSVSLVLAGVELPAALTAAFGQATPTVEPAEPVDVTGEGVVRFLCGYNSPSDCSAYNELVEQFEAEHPDVQVELVQRQSIRGLAGPSGAPLSQEVLDDVAARVDVGLGWLFLLENSDPARHVINLAPYIEAQPGMSRADFFPGVLNDLYDGNIWALPTSFAPVLLYYNKNIFDEAGVPYPTAAWTQADFLRAAEQLTKRDGERITQAGFADPLGQGRNLFVNRALGTQSISGLTSPALVEAVHWYTALQTEHRVMRDLPDTFGRLSVEARGAIEAGNVAMWVDSSLYPIVSRRPTSGNPMDWGVTDVPSPYAPTGLFFGEGFAISVQAAEPAAAWQWIEFLSRHPIDIEPPSDSEYAMPQGFPTRRSVAEATDFWRYWTEQERADIENALTELASQGEMWNEQAYKLSEGLYTAYGIINQSLLANNSVDVREALAQAQAQLGVTLQTREQTPIEEQSMFLDPAPYAYTIQEGDTLYRVATRYASRVEWIVEANKLADANDFQVGDELIIPNARVFVDQAGASTDSAIRPAPITVGYANLEADATYALYRSRQDSVPLVDAVRGVELEQSLRLPVVARSEDNEWLRICCYNGELVWLAAAEVTVEQMENVPIVAAATTEDSTSTQAAEPVDVTDEGVVRFGCITEFECELYEPLLEEFQTENPSIKVELVSLEDSTTFPTNEMPEDNLLEVASSRTDVFQAWSYLTEADQASRYLLDLAPYIEAEPGMTSADFYPQTLSISQRDNGTWVLPTSFSPALLYYNKDIFDEAGLDYPTAEWTQDDFLQAAKQLTQRDGELFTQQGFADYGNWGLDLFVRAALDSPNVNMLTSPEMIEAASWYADLALEHGVMRSLPSMSSANSSVDGNSIKAGNVAMWTDSPMYALLYKRPVNLASFDWGVTAVPSPYASTVVLPSDLLAISRNAADPGASWQWIEFLSRHPIYGEPLDDSEDAMPFGIPTRRSVAEAGDYWRYWSAQERADIEQALDNAAPLWFADEGQQELYTFLRFAFDEIQQGVAVEEALANAQLQLGVNLLVQERIEAGDDPTTMDTESLLYTVREGDTLGKIAAAYNVDVETIVKANALDDLKNLAAGDELLIPGARVFIDAEGRLISDRVDTAYAFLERDGRYTLYRLPGDATPLASSLNRAELGESLRLPVVGRSEDNAWLRVCCYNGELVWLAAADVTVENLEDVPVVAAAPAPEPTAAGFDLPNAEDSPSPFITLHTVEADDTLDSIAAEYGVRIEDIYNEIGGEPVDADALQVGVKVAVAMPYVKATQERVDLREAPSAEAPLVGRLRAETDMPLRLEARTEDGSWLQVCCWAEQSVWVAADEVDVTGDVEAVHVTASLPILDDTLDAPPVSPPSIEAKGLVTLYKKPTVEAQPVARLAKGLPLPLVGRNEDDTWLQLCCISGESVWVEAASVEVRGELTSVLMVAPGAQPTVQKDELQVVDFAHGIELYPHDDSFAMFNALLETSQYFDWVKRDVPWSRFHPQQRLSLDYAELTQFVREAGRQNANVLLTITLRPELARDRGGQTAAGPAGEFDVLAEELGKMAGRFCGGPVKAIEVWDEQNLHYNWSDEQPDAEAYMELLRGAHGVIKEACPSMLVISGGLTPAGNHREGIAVDNLEYLEAMLANGLARYADGIGIHLAGYNVPPSAPFEEACEATTEDAVTFDGACDSPHHSWSFASTLAGYRDLLDAYNVDLPLWPTEFGWGAGTAVDDRYRYVEDNTREEQAAWTLEAFDLLRAAGTGPAFLYNFDAGIADPNSIGAQWSILDVGGEPLPVYDALRERLSGESTSDLPLPQTSRCQDEAVQIVSPQRGELVGGVVEIRGTATRPRFADKFTGYRLGWAASAYSEDEGEWAVEGDKAVEDAVLGTLDTSTLPNGSNTLRLVSMSDSTGVSVCEVVINVHN